MRVLLDESVPRQLAPLLRGHEVTTVQRHGWAGTRNGELLRRASQEFQVLVTGDQGFQFQQNLSGVSLGVVIIAARDNRVVTVLGLADKRMQLAARGLWSASAAGRRPFELRADLDGFAAGRRAVYGRCTAGVS